MTPSLLIPAAFALLGATTMTATPGARAAIVCRIQGKATLAVSGQALREIALYDWLPAGGRLETGPEATLSVVFASGERFEVEAGTVAVVEGRALRATRGRVSRLASLPMIPGMARSAAAEVRGRPGSVTIRRPGPPQPWWTSFRPAADGALLASAAELAFEPRAPGGRHTVEVFNAQGAVIHRATVEAGRLPLPGSLLRPGAWYAWRAVPEDAPDARPLEARFHTVQARHAAVRARLAEAAAKDAGSEAKALLKAMDAWLGLEATP